MRLYDRSGNVRPKQARAFDVVSPPTFTWEDPKASPRNIRRPHRFRCFNITLTTNAAALGSSLGHIAIHLPATDILVPQHSHRPIIARRPLRIIVLVALSIFCLVRQRTQ